MDFRQKKTQAAMSKHTPEITEADRKAISTEAEKIINDPEWKGKYTAFTIGFTKGAEWGILHARANDLYMQGYNAAIRQAALAGDRDASRIKELEAEVATMKEAIASNDLKTLGRIAQEQAAALWNENERLHEENHYLTVALDSAEANNKTLLEQVAALQSPSKDTPGRALIKQSKQKGREYAESIFPQKNFDFELAEKLRVDFAHAYQVGYLAASSPVSVDINSPIEIFPTLHRTILNGFVVRRGTKFNYDLVAVCATEKEADEIAAALSRAQKPDTKQSGE
jgi:hypothetical protein